jgi:hypothetical protein
MWGFGGAARRRLNRMEDLNVKVCKEATDCIIRSRYSGHKARAGGC